MNNLLSLACLLLSLSVFAAGGNDAENSKNEKLFLKKLKTCTPIKTKLNSAAGVVRETDIDGKKGEFCKVKMTDAQSGLQYICDWNKKDIAAVQKDFSNREKMDSIINETCEAAVDMTKPNAKQTKKNLDVENQHQADSVASIVSNMQSEANKLKEKCAKDKKSSACKELEDGKKMQKEFCARKNTHTVCKVSFN
jgi:hypothetical protein